MSYQLQYEPGAQKQLRKLPRHAQQWIADAVEQLKSNPRPPGCLKLTDSPDWRIEVHHHYRVRYRIDDTQRTVTILKLGTRGGFYG